MNGRLCASFAVAVSCANEEAREECLVASLSLDVPANWLYFRPEVTREKLDAVFLVYREVLHAIEVE